MYMFCAWVTIKNERHIYIKSYSLDCQFFTASFIKLVSSQKCAYFQENSILMIIFCQQLYKLSIWLIGFGLETMSDTWFKLVFNLFECFSNKNNFLKLRFYLKSLTSGVLAEVVLCNFFFMTVFEPKIEWCG